MQLCRDIILSSPLKFSISFKISLNILYKGAMMPGIYLKVRLNYCALHIY